MSSATSLKRASLPMISAAPSWTFSRTVLLSSSSGSCMRMPTLNPGVMNASPLDGCSRPAMIFSTVDLPAPLGPTTPIFAPGRKFRVTSSRITLSPCALRVLRMV